MARKRFQGGTRYRREVCGSEKISRDGMRDKREVSWLEEDSGIRRAIGERFCGSEKILNDRMRCGR
jgi:hypothetical protein